MSALAALAALALATAEPPLAAAGPWPTAAAEAGGAAAVRPLDPGRLRLSAGAGILHHQTLGPGGNSPGVGTLVALEGRHGELAAAAWAFQGMGAGDGRSRQSGVSSAQLRLGYRFLPVPARLQVLLETGATLSREAGWSYCSLTTSGGADCATLPPRLSAGLVAGAHLRRRLGAVTGAVGTSFLLTAVRWGAGDGAADGFLSPLSFHLWLEVGAGGLR